MKTWTHYYMLEYDYDAAMLKKEASKKRIAAWDEADCMLINWKPFYDTSYDINQITWIHNINETLQLAQKDTYASEL